MDNTRQKHVKWFICKRKLFDENWLEAHYPQYHPISMNEGLLPDGMLPSAGWDRPEPSWFDFGQCTWIAIDERSQLILLPIVTVPGAPPPEDTPDEDTIDPQKSHLTCTTDPTKTRAHRQVVGVEHAQGKASAKQLEYATSIASTQNNGIHGIHFSQHMTFNRLNHLAAKWKCG